MEKRRFTAIYAPLLAVALVASAAAPAARAQAQHPPTPPEPGPGMRQHAPQREVPPAAPGAGTSVPGDGATSDALSRSGGVIRPPADADPEMAKPAPEPGPRSTPVIPPPGTTGGNSEVQPK